MTRVTTRMTLLKCPMRNMMLCGFEMRRSKNGSPNCAVKIALPITWAPRRAAASLKCNTPARCFPWPMPSTATMCTISSQGRVGSSVWKRKRKWRSSPSRKSTVFQRRSVMRMEYSASARRAATAPRARISHAICGPWMRSPNGLRVHRTSWKCGARSICPRTTSLRLTSVRKQTTRKSSPIPAMLPPAVCGN